MRAAGRLFARGAVAERATARDARDRSKTVRGATSAPERGEA